MGRSGSFVDAGGDPPRYRAPWLILEIKNSARRSSSRCRTEYCLARAERLRMLMLTASDPAAAIRLRGFMHKYRTLAERAKTKRDRYLARLS